MNELKIQIIEMFREIYYLNDEESLEIYNKFFENKTEEELQKIAKNLLDVIKKKNEILKQLSLNITKNINKFNEEYEKESEIIDINI